MSLKSCWAETGVGFSLDALLTAIVTWLSFNYDLPAVYDHPSITWSSREYIAEIRYTDTQLQMRREVVAVYDDATQTIYLPDTWTGKTPAELSILVHEMVHHLQNKANLATECPVEREKLAYAAQEKWLHMFGTDLEQSFEINPMTLKLATTCMFH